MMKWNYSKGTRMTQYLQINHCDIHIHTMKDKSTIIISTAFNTLIFTKLQIQFTTKYLHLIIFLEAF